MIDLHCHLDLYPKPQDIIERCEKGTEFVLSVTTTPSAYKGTLALSPDKERIPTALGLHPQLAAERFKELSLFDEILPLVDWVGEIGLDGSPECRNTWESQIKVFDHVLGSCSRAGGRLMSIHSRSAAKPVLDRLAMYPDAGAAILHWFSGSKKELSRAISAGCWFSIGLPMLRSQRGRTIVDSLPRDRVLTETDGPFAQCEGRPLYPWDSNQTAHELAELWREPVSETASRLLNNLRRLQLLTKSLTTENSKG